MSILFVSIRLIGRGVLKLFRGLMARVAVESRPSPARVSPAPHARVARAHFCFSLFRTHCLRRREMTTTMMVTTTTVADDGDANDVGDRRIERSYAEPVTAPPSRGCRWRPPHLVRAHRSLLRSRHHHPLRGVAPPLAVCPDRCRPIR